MHCRLLAHFVKTHHGVAKLSATPFFATKSQVRFLRCCKVDKARFCAYKCTFALGVPVKTKGRVAKLCSFGVETVKFLYAKLRWFGATNNRLFCSNATKLYLC